METISSRNPSLGDGNRDMEMLCEAFGSAFSLEVIASAYSQASRNVEMAGALLYDLQGQSFTTAQQLEHVETASVSSSSSDVIAAECQTNADGNAATIGPNKVAPAPFEGEQFVIARNQTGKDDNSMNQDMEEFLFKMLGDGFQLDKNMIHQVLGLCGYDLEKSMETLVDLSASSLGKSDDVVSRTAETEMRLMAGLSQDIERSVNNNGEELCKKKKDKKELQREILGSLFSAPGRVEEQPKRTISRNRVVRRSGGYGRLVDGPLKETEIEETFVAIKPLGEAGQEEEGDENSYHALRQAVSEYWNLMKEYYKAAAEAYAKGDQSRAFRLQEEGQFYRKKALEADEKSVQKNLETSCREDEVLLNMTTSTPREAVKNLRRNLLLFAGMPNTRYLKLMVGNDDAQSKRKGRKQLVVEELEKESIKWSEEDDGKTIVIQVDEVNPKSLSFAKN